MEDVKKLLSSGFKSAVGHSSTAQVMSQLLGIQVSTQRIPIKLQIGDTLVVLQILTRLPEGRILTAEEVKNLPAKWLIVSVVNPQIKRTCYCGSALGNPITGCALCCDYATFQIVY